MADFMRVEDLKVYRECVKMLNGLEKTLERRLNDPSPRWPPDLEPEA